MQAAYLKIHGGPEVLEVGELPTPEPGANEVRVRVKRAALNHLDVWVRKGLPGLKLAYPHILGGDAAGVVDKVGGDVTSAKPGDEVIVHPGISCLACENCLNGWESLCRQYKILGEHIGGTNAEFVVVPAANVFAKPKNLSFEEAASIPLVFTTAWQMLVKRARVKPGDRVLVHAAGSGVSTAAIQIARVHGAEIIATSTSDEKLARAKALGAHHLINSAKGDFAVAVKKIARGGVDIIIDHVGKDFFDANFRSVKWGGAIVMCGATSGHEVTVDLRRVFFSQIQLMGSTMGSKGDFPTILKLAAEGQFRAIVDRVFPLANIADAHRHLEAREQFGKVVLDLEAACS